MGFKKEKLLELGLISQSKGKYYDKFRGRVMFPIMNTSGKVIGFGGRDRRRRRAEISELPGVRAYFQKKNNLYGLNLTRTGCWPGRCQAILVEGYMDVSVPVPEPGVRNVSASLGTALTENQARLLKRYTENVVLVLRCRTRRGSERGASRGLDILHRERLPGNGSHGDGW